MEFRVNFQYVEHRSVYVIFEFERSMISLYWKRRRLQGEKKPLDFINIRTSHQYEKRISIVTRMQYLFKKTPFTHVTSRFFHVRVRTATHVRDVNQEGCVDSRGYFRLHHRTQSSRIKQCANNLSSVMLLLLTLQSAAYFYFNKQTCYFN